jgi:serine/threonine-protein kinase
MLRSPEAGSAARPFLATPADEWYVELSPDGEWVAYESNESGRSEIYLRRFPEGEGQWLVSTGGGHSARWNPNGREIFYLDGEYLDGDKVMAVDIGTDGESPRLGKPRLVFERPISDVWSLGQNYDVAPDGQSFVIVERGEPTPEPDHLVLVQNFDDELRRLLAEAAGS